MRCGSLYDTRKLSISDELEDRQGDKVLSPRLLPEPGIVHWIKHDNDWFHFELQKQGTGDVCK